MFNPFEFLLWCSPVFALLILNDLILSYQKRRHQEYLCRVNERFMREWKLREQSK